jgi:hypothetical protein
MAADIWQFQELRLGVLAILEGAGLIHRGNLGFSTLEIIEGRITGPTRYGPWWTVRKEPSPAIEKALDQA